VSKSSPDWRHFINYETPLQFQTVLEKFKVWTRHCNWTGLVWSRSTVLHTRTVFTPLRNLAVELLFLNRARLSEANMKTEKYTTRTFSLWIVPDRPFLTLKCIINFCVIPPSEKNNFSTNNPKQTHHFHYSFKPSQADTAPTPTLRAGLAPHAGLVTDRHHWPIADFTDKQCPPPNVFDPLTPNVAMWVYSYKASYSRAV